MIKINNKNKKKTIRKDCHSDKVFYIINSIIMLILAIIVIYPLYFIVIASFSDPDAVYNGDVYLLPIRFTLSGYKRLFQEKLIWIGYRNSLLYTVIGTALNIVMTIPTGYALSRKELPFRKGIVWYFTITLFFGGGIIPFYLIVSKLGMVNSPLALIIPSAMSVWNVFMTKAYYESNIPMELIEASKIDGANEFKIFTSVILPLSKAIVAVMILFYAVGHWNSYFDGLIFLTDENLYPLQLVLKDILISAEAIGSGAGNADTILEQAKIANQIKYTSIIISSLPMIILYPFVQKHFEKGFLVGSFK